MIRDDTVIFEQHTDDFAAVNHVGQRIRIRPHHVDAVDATGAGDTFDGSFLARLLEGDDPETAARYANVAAALSTTGYGAVTPIPRKDGVLAALKLTA